MPDGTKDTTVSAGGWLEVGRLREILDAMPYKIWIVRPDGCPLYYNKAMRAFAGAALELPDRSSRERALLHPDDISRMVAARNAALTGGQPWEIELRLKFPQGGWRWHRLNFSMLRDGGEAGAWLVTATDIDDLRQALVDARENAERLRLAAESAQLGIYSFDLETRAHEWSPELKSIFGLAPGAPVPDDVVRLVHPEDRARFERLRRASFGSGSDGTFEDEHRIVRPDGSIRWVFVKGMVSFAGEGAARRAKGGLGLVLDITERKLSERALAQSEERYRLLVDTANDIVATLDLEGRFTSINPAVTHILGYDPAEVIGAAVDSFIPESELAMQDEMLKRKLEGEESTRYELQVFGKDRRQRFTLEVNSRLMFNAEGQPVGLHSIARDVTERKAAEARQKILVRELQHRTKNLLAVIQSIAGNTLLHSKDLHAARDALMGRLHALAHAQEFVASGAGGGAPLRDLVDAELSSFGARTKVEGEFVMAGSAFAQMFALIVHELATNAMKYGALSGERGEVAVSWSTESGAEGPELHFTWRERSGPVAGPPARKGFGTQLMGLIGTSRLAFEPEGLEYTLTVPLADVVK